jgi:hypothetical protein
MMKKKLTMLAAFTLFAAAGVFAQNWGLVGDDTLMLWNYNGKAISVLQNIPMKYYVDRNDDANEKMEWRTTRGYNTLVLKSTDDEGGGDFEYFLGKRVVGQGAFQTEQINPVKWRYTLYFREGLRNEGFNSGDVLIIEIQEKSPRRH